MLGVAVIGCGGMGSSHARAIANISGLSVVCGADPSETARSKFSTDFDVPSFERPSEALQQNDVEIAIIAMPHDLHATMTIEALAAGKHVLCEKPMAITSAECESMNAAAVRAGKKLMVGMTWHFNPATTALRQIVSSGRIGHPLFAEDIIAKNWNLARRPDWFKARAQGGGMWVTNGIHQIDRLSWIMGDRITSIDAKSGTFQHAQDADDMTMAAVRFAGGAFASISCFGFARGVDRHEIAVWGSDGAARFVDGTVEIGVEGSWRTVECGDWPPIERELEAFRQSIEHDSKVPVDGEWGKYTVDVVLAGEESSRLRKPVEVPEG
ncbi:MAG: Gfo/Idh/MocA family oxidoreductase [Chloroflexi bacterium]|nr:Gfo/Idh/MocA family oxidoreductase [Chloroflexota bacterium]MCY3938905.1 Gfo/Idh/MocA family oxidoreductase [Chloroflexota bacterium]